MLDYRMQTFLTLYREMNYRRTAEALRMTQPGVTQHIQYLEKCYHCKLFAYNGRTLSRTRSATLLKQYIDSVLAEEHALQEKLSQPERITLRVGATKTIGEFVIPPVLHPFLQAERHSIDLVIDNTEKLLRLLEDSQLDFAVIEGVFDKTHYRYHLFQREKFVGICAKTHPFAGKTVPIEEIFGQTLVLREKGSGTRALLEQAMAQHGFSLEQFVRVVSVSNFSVIQDIVTLDGAITFAYQPIAAARELLTTFSVENMEVLGEFNFVYCNETIAREKIDLLFSPAQDG